jgi:hypothetical protein
MRTRQQRISGGLRISLAAAVLFLLFSCPSLFAQTAPASERLSPDTVFYMQWRGLASLAGANKQNHALQLWNDPDFAPIRAALAMAVQQNSKKQADKAAKPSMEDILSLLDNGAVFGVVVNPAASNTSASDGTPSNAGVFLVYDSTGKTALVQKFKSASETKAKEPPITRNYDFGGTSIEVRTSAKDTSYSAQVANYFIFASRKETIEDLITRFRAAEKPATSVTQSAEYRMMRPYLGSDAALEIFGRVPDLNKLIPPDQQDKPLGQFASKFQFGKFHALGGSLSFNGEATRMRGALLGDASPGGLFDLAGVSSTSFQTQAIVDGGPLFTITRIDLAAFYHSLRKAISAALPQQQAGSVAMGEGMAQNYLGMPIEDALGLFTGEIASSTAFADDGSPQRTFAVTIQKPQDLLGVLRKLCASLIVSEDTSGQTTFLDMSYPYQDPVTGKQRRTFYYVAVTPHMLYAAPRKTTLREAMQRENAKPGAVSVDPEFARMRAMLPEKLSGLGGADIARIPWDKLIAYYGQQATAAAQKEKGADVPQIDWSKLVKPDVFSRHLRISVSGWWKDANGVYFDSYVQ